jgi:hypothetical protein
MFKVHVLATCSHCNAEACLLVGEGEDCQGNTHTHYAPCPICEGSDNEPRWVDLEDFAILLHWAECPHEYTSHQGSMHFSTGDVWDDI